MMRNSPVTLIFNRCLCGVALAKLGAMFLMFREDNGGTVLHSQTNADLREYVKGIDLPESYLDKLETWQKPFGYMDFYDEVFKWGTGGNMDMEKFKFNDVTDEEYILWIWRGDYLNLGSGAEMGIYKTIPGTEDWEDDISSSVNFELPMTLSLYNYVSKDAIETVFNWAPDNDQWWITGFNPDFDEPDVHEMVSVGSVDFSSKPEMYNSILESKDKISGAYNENVEKYMLFDEENKTIWVMWGNAV